MTRNEPGAAGLPEPVRLYRPQGPHRVAVASVEPSATAAGRILIRVARGSGARHLSQGTAHGPYPAEEAAQRLAQAVESLRAEGFVAAGLAAMLTALQSPDSKVRARAALRLGQQGGALAVEKLLGALPHAVDDVCSILDALGAAGDARAVPALREYARRQLLSRRRSAVEALRRLGDAGGLAEARDLALQRLPEPVRQRIEAAEASTDSAGEATKLVQAVVELSDREQGPALDTLYELADAPYVKAVRRLLGIVPFNRPGLWRAVKSVYKRSMLRGDFETFGLLSHAIEARGRTEHGATATVKSGYDGVQRKTTLFGRRTRDYLRRAAWRHLRTLALHRPQQYAHAAAEVLVRYGPEDAAEPKGLAGRFATCYLLQRILYGESRRFRFKARSMRFTYRSAKAAESTPTEREEAFPHLWDAEPSAYLRVLGAGRLLEAQAFAYQALTSRHPSVIEHADAGQILELLASGYAPAVELAVAELDRRLDPDRPDWELLETLLRDERPQVLELGRRWLQRTAGQWTADPGRSLRLLSLPDAASRAVAAELLLEALPTAPAERRRRLAGLLLELVRAMEPAAGLHEAAARVAREGLLAEIEPMLPATEWLALTSGGSPGAQALAGDVLRAYAGPLEQIGLERVVALAGHELAAVRSAAHALLRRCAALLREDPSPLFTLVESRWRDTRAAASEVLRTEVDPARLGLEGLLGLLDSNQAEVQQAGHELALRHLDRLDAAELVSRLMEHPGADIRAFALELMTGRLATPPPLPELERFLRAGLFALDPRRKVKTRLIELIVERGLAEPAEASTAARLLGEIVQVRERADFEEALEGLVRLRLAYPELDTPIVLAAGGAA
jgi:hypothetical protein